MRTFKEYLKESQKYPTFREIDEKYADPKHQHHIRKECIKCGKVQTCRCSAPKKTIKGVCTKCSGEKSELPWEQ